MIAFLTAHWKDIATSILAIGEIVSLFVPGAQGTVKTLVSALVGAGAKDPGIGA